MIRANAPASSANLGPGFDCLAVALTLRNELKVTRGRGAIHIRGEGDRTLPRHEKNLVARCIEQASGGAVDRRLDRLDLHCHNRIPLARGLGSSTAAAAIGLMAGWCMTDRQWTADELFDELVSIDGHPDNAAAVAYGGFVLAQTRPDGTAQPTLIDTPLPLCFLAVVPERELETTAARAALPATYERGATVKALGAAALLVMGLERGDETLISEALHCDVLHEPYRADLVPELGLVRERARDLPVLGATMSGAGPTVLVWCSDEEARAHTHERLRYEIRRAQVYPLDVSMDAATARRGR